MQDDVEVLFCDLCSTSVPVQDLEAGRAVRHQGKVIGSCCLDVLRGGAAAGRQGAAGLAEPALPGATGTSIPEEMSPPAAGARASSAAAGGESRLLPVAIAVLAAIAAATIYLDQRIGSTEDALRQVSDQVGNDLRAQGDVLANLSASTDALVRREDLGRVIERVGTVEAASQQIRDDQTRQSDADAQRWRNLELSLAAIKNADVDYRPMFDELRLQLQRQAVAIAELRAAPNPPPRDPGGAAPGQIAPGAIEPSPGAAVPGLPAELAHQVRRLKDADPAERFEAVYALLQSKDPRVLEHVLPLTKDADSLVRRLTVDGLREFRQAVVIEALLVALADPADLVADTAWRSLKELTGQKLPFDANDSKEARARAQQRWREWWEKNKASFGS